MSFQISYWALIPLGAAAWLITVLHIVMEPWRWRVAYLDLGIETERKNKVRDALYCTALATYLLPFKLGMPLRVGLLKSSAGLELKFIVGVLAMDWLISMVAWSLVAGLSMLVAAIHWQPPVYMWVLAAGLAVAVGLWALFQSSLAEKVKGRWHDGLLALRFSWRRIASSLAILIADVSSYGLRHAVLIVIVVGSIEYAWVGAAIGIVSTFAGIVSGLPMGLVGYDATLVALLGATGVPVEQALAIAILNRSLNITAAAALGIPAAARLGMGTGLRPILRKLKGLANGKN